MKRLLTTIQGKKPNWFLNVFVLVSMILVVLF